MALDGPIDTKIKTCLQNALKENLDDLLSRFMNAYVLQQRIVLVTKQFEYNPNLTLETKTLLQDLDTAAQAYLDNFDKQLLLAAIENALMGLRSGQGMIINLTQSAKACSEIAQLLRPIKEDLIHRVTIDSLLDSFVLMEMPVLTTAAPLPPPPPPLSSLAQPKLAAAPLKPVAKVSPTKAALEREFNRELLLKKLTVIEKELSQTEPVKAEAAENIPKLRLNIKRELATVALEAERRRELKRLAAVRSDPSSVVQAPNLVAEAPTSRGILFLSMLQSELGVRNQRGLKAKAQRQQAAAIPSANNDQLPIEEELEKLQISNNKLCN